MSALNIDEAMDKSMDKILNVLVRFYDEDAGSVKTIKMFTQGSIPLDPA